ncbi:DNA helicase [Swinepox virus]|uniref:DNA helicase n=1 Tax=Swinepox virus TaxID=10276 RepID=A0A881SY96_SWPV|nr:DNA helicase [Swinepox virus]
MSICSVIDYNLYKEIKKVISTNQLFLFNYKKEFVEVPLESSMKFLIPPGLFSSTIPLIYPFENNTTINYTRTASIILPELYPIQKRVVSEVIRSMRKKILEKRPLYITLHLACGFGKTITASYLIAMHKRRTIICLPNKMLASQWKHVIESTKLSYIVSLDGVQQLMKILMTESADVLIIINRHLTNEDFCKKIYTDYDTFILDESHMYNLMNNTAVTRFLTFYPPRICYFLTATPRSYNRIYCNDVINVLKYSELKKTIKVIDYFFDQYSSESIRNMVKKVNHTDNKYHVYTEKILSEDRKRNELIVDTIISEFNSDTIKRVIIVTKLRKHMLFFYDKLVQEFNNDLVYIGDAKNKSTPDIVKNIRERDKFIFISTVHYAGTGLDIPSLDSLFICCAVMNTIQIEQLFGRICRDYMHQNRTVYLFPSTSIKEIKHLIGFFTQKIITVAIEKLGFIKDTVDKGHKEELALFRAFNVQNH